MDQNKFDIPDPFDMDKDLSDCIPSVLRCAIKSRLLNQGILIQFVYRENPSNHIWMPFRGLDMQSASYGYECNILEILMDEYSIEVLRKAVVEAYSGAIEIFVQKNRDAKLYLSLVGFIAALNYLVGKNHFQNVLSKIMDAQRN